MKNFQTLLILICLAAMLAGCTSTDDFSSNDEGLDNDISKKAQPLEVDLQKVDKVLYKEGFVCYKFRLPVYEGDSAKPARVIKIGKVVVLGVGRRIYAEDIEDGKCDEEGNVISTKKYKFGFLIPGENKIIPIPTRAYFENGDSRIYVMQPGDTLWELGMIFYSNRHYSKVIGLHNNITEPEKIRVNTKIKVPKLDVMLKEEGFDNVASEEIGLILNARKLFMKHEKQIFKLREKNQEITANIKHDLLKAAGDIDKAVTGLSTPKPGIKKIPKNMIGQLKSISTNLKQLAQGAKDGYGYDMDMVHQRMVYALLNGIKWARNGFE